MKAAPRTPAELFSAPVRYVVPLFQRPYVWNEQDQWAPLWADVVNLAESALASAESSTNVPPHFLGAVVVEQQRGQVGFIPIWHIIDGQQRFTTLQLLIDAVQEIVDELGEPRDSRALQSLVLNDPDLAAHEDDQFKVWPTNRDEDAFRAAMTNGSEVPSAMSAKPIARAHKFFKEAARQWAITDPADDGEVKRRLHALVVCLRSHLRVVAIDLDEDDNAQVIFESLNYRGSRLLAADLIKNLVFQQAKLQGLDVFKLYDTYWSQLDGDQWRADVTQGRLRRPRIDTFMNHWLVMKLHREVSSDRIYAEFRDHIASRSLSLVELLRELSSDANVYDSFENRPATTREGVLHYRVIDALDSSVIMPVVLWLLRWPEDDLPTPQRDKALGAIESWLVRRALLRLTSKDLNRTTFDLLEHLSQAGPAHAGDVVESYLLAQESPSRVWPDDESLAAKLAHAPLYQELTRPRLRMILEALEDDIRAGSMGEGVICPRGLTVEHVMPQSWRANWPLAAPDPDAERARDERVQTLGNLTLVTGSHNSALSNRPWLAPGGAGKRDYLLANSHLKLNAHLLLNDQVWLDGSIEQRTSELSARLLKIWPRPAGGASTASLVKELWADPSSTMKEAQASGGGAAAQLTREQRDPEAWLMGVADDRGFGQEFRLIVEQARALGLFVRFQNNWWIAKVTPQGQGNTTLIDLSADLETWVNEANLAAFLGCEPSVVRAALGAPHRPLEPQLVEGWVETLRDLFTHRTSSEGVASQ